LHYAFVNGNSVGGKNGAPENYYKLKISLLQPESSSAFLNERRKAATIKMTLGT